MALAEDFDAVIETLSDDETWRSTCGSPMRPATSMRP